MSPRSISEPVLREPPLLRGTDTVETAVRRVLESELPALPVVDERDRFVGIFGEREFMGALFPGYWQPAVSSAHTEPSGGFLVSRTAQRCARRAGYDASHGSCFQMWSAGRFRGEGLSRR
jgi:hypothetical protein